MIRRVIIRFCLGVLIGFVAGTLLLTTSAHPMRRVVQPYPGGNARLEAIIDATWPPQLRSQALDVSHCESRGKPTAANGTHRGLFQMGTREWAKYGDGNNVFDGYDNAAAAFRMWTDRGWSAWECWPRRTS